MNISELELFTDKLKEQKEFYSDILGLEILSKQDNSFTLKTGASKLTFIETGSIENPYYHYAFNIPENRIDDAINWLKEKNIGLIEYENSTLIDFKNWNAHSVYFYDPGGNIVELIARHNLSNSSNDKFSAQSLLNISEAGMPVENVGDFCKTIEENFDEKLWSGNFETFAAVGDEEGLFIIVTTNRNWFPTDKPCNIFPMKIKIYLPEIPDIEIDENGYHITAVESIQK
jgi:catechol 2,3-dioxygenase-like lactoylglutathione lyase family enzyme